MSFSAGIEERLHKLADALAANVSRRYRLAPEEAARRILEVWARDKALHAALAKSPDIEMFGRTRAYKNAARAATKNIYYALRRYRADGISLKEAADTLEAITQGTERDKVAALVQNIAANHASTAERANHLDIFCTAMLEAVGDARSVLDVGAGVLPLLFPFEQAPKLLYYAACDRDPVAMRVVSAYGRWRGDGRLKSYRWNLRDGWAPVCAACGTDRFDVALMLKLVPVVRRQEPELLQTLASVPARMIVITGSKEALAKRRAIARREMAVIDEFVGMSGFRALRTFETPDEIGIVAAKED